VPCLSFVVPAAKLAWPVLAGEGEGRLSLKDILDAGGTIGYLIIALSILMAALIVQLLIIVRRAAMMPRGLADEVHELFSQGKIGEAEEACNRQPSVLARMLSAGLAEVRIGYAAVEKAMEDAATEQAARLLRRVEYLSTIGTVAPMLGLLGTVWGMILAFLEFETKANPQVSELAPGIYRALVTTLFGLMVAVPAVAAYSIFRNRIDERIAETALLAEHVFADFKLRSVKRKAEPKAAREQSPAAYAGGSPSPHVGGGSIPPVAPVRERRS
jgi:biopolymer transport protein ExbB